MYGFYPRTSAPGGVRIEVIFDLEGRGFDYHWALSFVLRSGVDAGGVMGRSDI